MKLPRYFPILSLKGLSERFNSDRITVRLGRSLPPSQRIVGSTLCLLDGLTIPAKFPGGVLIFLRVLWVYPNRGSNCSKPGGDVSLTRPCKRVGRHDYAGNEKPRDVHPIFFRSEPPFGAFLCVRSPLFSRLYGSASTAIPISLTTVFFFSLLFIRMSFFMIRT